MPRLFHSTAYPAAIEKGGLKPFQNRTRGGEEGAFVFATADEAESLTYAFKTNDSFPARMISVGNIADENGTLKSCVALIGKVEAYRNALSHVMPTRFEINDVSSFRNVIHPKGVPTVEWVSSNPVPSARLTAERIDFQRLRGMVEFFECVGDREISIDKAGGYSQAYEQGLIRSVNESFGFPSILLRKPGRRSLSSTVGWAITRLVLG